MNDETDQEVIDYLFGDEPETEEYTMNPDKVKRGKRLAKNAAKKRRKHERTLHSNCRNARKLLCDSGKSHYRMAVKSVLRRGDYDNGILGEDYYLNPWDWS